MDVIERSRVEVPPHVTRPFEVYLNGVPQQRNGSSQALSNGETAVLHATRMLRKVPTR